MEVFTFSFSCRISSLFCDTHPDHLSRCNRLHVDDFFFAATDCTFVLPVKEAVALVGDVRPVAAAGRQAVEDAAWVVKSVVKRAAGSCS